MGGKTITLEVDLSGLHDLIQRYPGAVNDFLDAEAESIVRDIKLSFGTSPPGRAYKRGQVTHIASQPGYPPNVDTEALRGSIRWEQADNGRARDICDGVVYGLRLELGGSDERGVYVAPRPFMGPAFARARNGFRERLERALRRAARG